MTFRTFLLALNLDERRRVAERVGSSVGYLQQVAYGNKQIELGLADALVAVSEGKVSLAELPLTDRARHQHHVRTGRPLTLSGVPPDMTSSFAPSARSDARYPAKLADHSCRPGAMSRAEAVAGAGLLSSSRAPDS